MQAVQFHDLDTFTQSYVETALWSSTDESDPETGGNPMDDNYGPEDIAPETLTAMANDCQRFQTEQGEWITEENYLEGGRYSAEEIAGHHFWLTRNGHGSGFWNGQWAECADEALTKASEAFGEYHLYVGDDGKIYGYPG